METPDGECVVSEIEDGVSLAGQEGAECKSRFVGQGASREETADQTCHPPPKTLITPALFSRPLATPLTGRRGRPARPLQPGSPLPGRGVGGGGRGDRGEGPRVGEARRQLSRFGQAGGEADRSQAPQRGNETEESHH